MASVGESPTFLLFKLQESSRTIGTSSMIRRFLIPREALCSYRAREVHSVPWFKKAGSAQKR
ncbi:hypothetical protein Hdeb2414_s0018g00538161 [Helianthus debilis subsp. tardiflorus]